MIGEFSYSAVEGREQESLPSNSESTKDTKSKTDDWNKLKSGVRVVMESLKSL